jgi:hypothetical protein
MTADPALDLSIVLIDSIAALSAAEAGAVVVSGSHGGVSAARYALGVPIAGVLFNDAGVGKDGAGIAGLALLQGAGVPAAAVSHASACIGEAADTLTSGVISHANEATRRRGVAPGESAREAATLLKAWPHT